MSAARAPVPPPCPYPGLVAFSDGYAELFCGRARAVKQIVDSVLAHRVSVVCGPSGGGKSSLINVGVLPAIERRNRERALDGEPRFYTAIHCANWDRRPAAAVRARLLRELPPAQVDALQEQPLVDVFAAATKQIGGRLLLVLDQFEEPFAAGRAPDWELATAIAEAPASVHVLIALREDALGQLDRFAQAVPGLLRHLLRIDHLDPQAAHEAIVEPAERWNKMKGTDPITVKQELVNAVIEQTTERELDPPRVQAPLLQLVMSRLCEEVNRGGAPGRVLDRALLARLEETAGIVADHVERATAGWHQADRDLLARMLDHLVAASGAKIPQSAGDLAERVDAPEAEVARVLERLTGPRILERVGERHQLVHDALAQPLLDWRRRWEQEQARLRGWRRLGVVVAFVAVLLSLAAYTHAFEPLESFAVGARFELRGPQPPPRDVLIVAIDKRSLDRLDQDWPVPRPSLGRLVEWIAAGSPKVIAYDGVLAGRSRLEADDDKLFNALDRSIVREKVVIAAEATAPGGRTNVFGGNDVLDYLDVRPGFVNFRDDVNGVIHRPIHSVDGVDSFAVAASEIATGRAVARTDVEHAWIDFYGPARTLRSVPYWQVLRHRVPPDAFRGKIVVIGPTDPGDTGYRRVWGLHARGMPDAELQATAIDTVRRELPLQSAPWWITLASIVALAALPPLLHRRLALAATLALSLAGGALFLLIAYAAFAWGGWMLLVATPPYAAFAWGGWMLLVATPLAALLFAALAVVLLAATPPAERRRRRVRSTTTAATLGLLPLLVAAMAGSASGASFATGSLVQLGAKLSPSDGTPYRALGSGVALSADGGTALDATGDAALIGG